MQIAPIVTAFTSTPVLAPSPTAAPARDLRAGRSFGMQLAPASPSLPVSLEGAIDGVVRLDTALPIVDFPGIVAGDVFDIVKGSKAGQIGVRGQAEILRMDPDHATFHVNAGRFGMKVDVTVDIEQIGPDQVRITSRGDGIPDMSELGRVVEQRTNYAVFEQVSDPSKRTVIAHDGRGGLVIDTVVPTVGGTHLVLQRR
ncbi:MAG: hypothetical protein ABI200_07805 [Gaiellales bacterium]